jgi:type IX secretion system substrate protein
MQRLTTKKIVKLILIFALNIVVGLGMMATAQEKSTNESKSISFTTLDDGKVKIKVITKSGDDQSIFEKTYDSHEAMKDDPELKEHGIESSDLNFGKGSFSFGNQNGNVFIKRGNGAGGFDDDDDDHGSFTFDFDLDSMETTIQRHFGANGNVFRFGFDGDEGFEMLHDSLSGFNFDFGSQDFQFDIDSLRTSFRFGGDGDAFWLNGEEFEDFEELRESLKEQFKDMDFDFNFGSWDSGDHDSEHEDGFRVISRAKVFIRSARDADKEKVGADQMEDLKINDISFYPNPSDGRFTVDISTGNENLVQIKIIDPDGGVVYEKSDQQTSGEYSFKVDLSEKRKGIYLLQVIQNNSSLTKRIIIE